MMGNLNGEQWVRYNQSDHQRDERSGSRQDGSANQAPVDETAECLCRGQSVPSASPWTNGSRSEIPFWQISRSVEMRNGSLPVWTSFGWR